MGSHILLFFFLSTACWFYLSNYFCTLISVVFCGPAAICQLSLELRPMVLGLWDILCTGCCSEGWSSSVFSSDLLIQHVINGHCWHSYLSCFLVWVMVFLCFLANIATSHGQTCHSVLLSLDLHPQGSSSPSFRWSVVLYLWLAVSCCLIPAWLFWCQCFVHTKYFYFPCLAMSLAVWVLGNDGFPLWVHKESLCFYLLKELWKICVIFFP